MTRDGFNFYKLYVALTRHFAKGNYDFFKYNGKVNVKEEHLERRNDKYGFEKAARILPANDWQDYLVSNLLASEKQPWIGSMSRDVMAAWRLAVAEMPVNFRRDLQYLFQSYEPHELVEGDAPPIIRLAIQRHISMETVVLLNSIINFTDSMKDDGLVVSNFAQRVRKYQPFLLQKITDTSYYSDIVREELRTHSST